jgi:hypothetical protein
MPSPELEEILAGRRVAAILAGSWRRSPSPLPLSPGDLEAATPLLALGGAGALAWHRLRASLPPTSRVARELKQHYRLATLHNAAREEAVRTLFRRLRTAGVEPLLIKGWSSALLYPEPGLRPSSDLDLCVAPAQVPSASRVLCGAPLPCPVDLHAGVPDLPDRTWPDIFARSRFLDLGGVPVRVLRPEDQLRLLCLHLARHGLARPLWLCDIAALAENPTPDFDWDLWRSGRGDLSAWAACVLGLARLLLGANGSAVPVPRWVEECTLWCWGAGPSTPSWLPLNSLCWRLLYKGLGPSPGAAAVKAALHLRLGPGPNFPWLAPFAAFLKRKIPHVISRLLGRRAAPAPFTLHSHA